MAVLVSVLFCLIAATPLVNANPSLSESDRVDIYRFWSVILGVTGVLIVVVVFSYWKEKKRSLNFNVRTFVFGVLVWFAVIFGLIKHTLP